MFFGGAATTTNSFGDRYLIVVRRCYDSGPSKENEKTSSAAVQRVLNLETSIARRISRSSKTDAPLERDALIDTFVTIPSSSNRTKTEYFACTRDCQARST